MLLRQMLYRCEIRFLPIIAGFWTKLNTVPDYESLISIICSRMLSPDVLYKMIMSPDGQEMTPCLQYLMSNNGIVPVSDLEEKFGPLRVDGIERIRREKRWLAPVSVTEKLWYRGFIFRENFMFDSESKSCYILPEDLEKALRTILPVQDPQEELTAAVPPAGRPATPHETQTVFPVLNCLPDIFTIYIACRRDGREPVFPGYDMSPENLSFLAALSEESGLFSPDNTPDAAKIREFLIQNRTAARIRLIRSWRSSSRYDELAENTSRLNVITPPVYDPREPREKLLSLLSSLPSDTWWSMNGFLNAIKRANAQFLRSTFTGSRGQIRDISGNDLSGIGSWFQLEGAWLEFLIFGPLQWLGIVQTADQDGEHSAFRLSRESFFLITESAFASTSEKITDKPNLELAKPTVSSDGAVTCSYQVPRYFRYMAARFCEIEKVTKDVCVFRITPNSVSEAENVGISRESFLALLKRFTGKAVPPSLEHLLDAGGKSKAPAVVYNATILTIPDKNVLSELLNTPRLEKWILQQINPTSLVIDVKGLGELRRFLMEKEIFVDLQI